MMYCTSVHTFCVTWKSAIMGSVFLCEEFEELKDISTWPTKATWLFIVIFGGCFCDGYCTPDCILTRNVSRFTGIRDSTLFDKVLDQGTYKDFLFTAT